MNYLIYGNEQYLINRHIEKIINNNKDSLVLRFDGSFKDDPTQEVLFKYNSNSLFDDKVLILFKNPCFLTSKVDNEFVAQLIDCLKKPSDNCTIVFYSSYCSFKSKLKTFKAIRDNCETHFHDKLNDNRFIELCNKEINRLNLQFDGITKDTFISNCGNNLEIFINCIKTLKEYDGVITNDVLNQLTYSSKDFGIFSLVNAIISKNISKSMFYIKKIQNDDSNIFGLISLLSSQLMFLYSVSYYSSVYKNDKEVMEAARITNPYVLKMAYKTLNNINQKEILKLVDRLAILDYEFKTSSTLNHELLFDLFISTLNS